MDELEVYNHYTISQEICGQGAFGVVKKAKRLSTGQTVAVKIISMTPHMKSHMDSIRLEAACMKCLDHNHIIKLFDTYETPSKFYMCMELVNGGELFDRIVMRTKYTEKDARSLIMTLLSIVKHCHERGVVHRDIKAENLLLVSSTDDSTVKLCDFGLASMNVFGNTIKGYVGTPDYMAPEIVNNSYYGPGVDIWAVGVLSYILLAGYPPFYERDPVKKKASIAKGAYAFHEKYWSMISPEAKDFIKKIMVIDQNERPSASKAMEHVWVKQLETAVSDLHLEETVEQLRSFNARRKLRASVDAVMAVRRMSQGLAMLRTSGHGPSMSTRREGISVDTQRIAEEEPELRKPDEVSASTDNEDEDEDDEEEAKDVLSEAPTSPPRFNARALRDKSISRVAALEIKNAALQVEIDTDNDKIEILLERLAENGFMIEKAETIDAFSAKVERKLAISASMKKQGASFKKEGASPRNGGVSFKKEANSIKKGREEKHGDSSDEGSARSDSPVPPLTARLIPAPPVSRRPSKLGTTQEDLQELKNLEHHRDTNRMALHRNLKIIETFKSNLSI